MRLLTMSGRLEAVFTGNEYMAIDLFDAVEAPGLAIPEGIAGAGLDESENIKEEGHGYTGHQF